MRRGLTHYIYFPLFRFEAHSRNEFPDAKGIDTVMVISFHPDCAGRNEFPDAKGIDTPQPPRTLNEGFTGRNEFPDAKGIDTLNFFIFP